MIKYTEEEHAFMREFVPGHSYKEIKEAFEARFGRKTPKSFPKSYIGNNKLSTGRTGRFEKGCVPVNKGKKMPTHIHEKTKHTMFKPGRVPQNTDPIGTEKNVDGYVWVKVNDIHNAKKSVNWVQKHRLVYEASYGPIPKNHAVIFLDGDTRNFDPSNLRAVSRGTLARLNQNGLIYKNAELTKVGINIAKLISKMTEAKKGEEKQCKK
jgi:hypothetical protein